MTQRIPELAKAAGDARIEIAGSDAWKLGIKDDDLVEVKSRYGVLHGRARVLPEGRPGLLFAAFYDAKLLINRVVADNVDPTSKQPEYKVTAVAVRRLEA
jgi:nitrate reductase NapA